MGQTVPQDKPWGGGGTTRWTGIPEGARGAEGGHPGTRLCRSGSFCNDEPDIRERDNRRSPQVNEGDTGTPSPADPARASVEAAAQAGILFPPRPLGGSGGQGARMKPPPHPAGRRAWWGDLPPPSAPPLGQVRARGRRECCAAGGPRAASQIRRSRSCWSEASPGAGPSVDTEPPCWAGRVSSPRRGPSALQPCMAAAASQDRDPSPAGTAARRDRSHTGTRGSGRHRCAQGRGPEPGSTARRLRQER